MISETKFSRRWKEGLIPVYGRLMIRKKEVLVFKELFFPEFWSSLHWFWYLSPGFYFEQGKLGQSVDLFEFQRDVFVSSSGRALEVAVMRTN